MPVIIDDSTDSGQVNPDDNSNGGSSGDGSSGGGSSGGGSSGDSSSGGGSSGGSVTRSKCSIKTVQNAKVYDYFLEDDENGAILVTINQIGCSQNLQYIFEHNISVQIENIRNVQNVSNQLLIQLSNEKFLFETHDYRFLNKTAILTQITKVQLLDKKSGLKQLLQTLTKQIAVITVKSRCNELTILPQRLSAMQATQGSEQVVEQSFLPLTDILGLINQGSCGPVKYSLAQKNQQQILPQKILAVDSYTIRLSARNATNFVGSFDMQLNFDLVDFNYRYSFPFTVMISQNQPNPNDKINPAAIIIPPSIKSLDPRIRTNLPEVSLMVDQLYIYQLPQIKRWKEVEKVQIEILITDPILTQCKCVTLIGNHSIQLSLPADYVGLKSTIMVTLSDGLDDSFYYLQVQGDPNVKPPEPEDPIVKPLTPDKTDSSTKENEDKSANLGNQTMLPTKVQSEEVDSQAEIERHKADLRSNVLEKCIPIYTKVSRNGEVTIKFARKLQIISTVQNLMEQIVSSGSIQLQILDEGLPQGSQPNKAFSWTLTMPDPYELKIKIIFEDPNAISSTSNDLDMLRIVFVDSSKFLKCETSQNDKSQRRLQTKVKLKSPQANKATEQISLQTTEKSLEQSRDSIPSGYVIIVDLPPQMTEQQLETQTKAVEAVNVPSKTTFFSCIAMTTLNNLSLQTLWGSINALQIISHLPLNNVNFPSNSYNFFQFLDQVVSFDLLNPTDHFDFKFTQTEPVNQRFADLGYQSSNFYENLGSIGLIAFIIGCRMILVPAFLMLIRPINLCRCCRTCQKKVETKCSTNTNIWLKFGLHTYFELLISSLVGLRLKDVIYTEKSWQDEFTIKSTYFFMAVVILYFLFVSYMTIIQVRPYVNFKKDAEEISRAKQQQKVYQNPRFQCLLDYGPNIFFNLRKPGDPPIRMPSQVVDPRVKIVGGHTNIKIALPPRRNKVLLARPEDLQKQVQPNFASIKYVQELYADLKHYKISAMPFYFFHLSRRLAFVFVAVYLSSEPFLQILSYLLQSLLMACYLAAKTPFVDPLTCKIELMNEFVILLVGYHMITLMSTNGINADIREKIGMSLISLIGAMFTANSLKYIYDQCKLSLLHCRRVKAKIIYTQRKKAFIKLYKQESIILERLATQATRKSDDSREVSDGCSERELDNAFFMAGKTPVAADDNCTFRKVEKLNTEIRGLLITAEDDSQNGGFVLNEMSEKSKNLSQSEAYYDDEQPRIELCDIQVKIDLANWRDEEPRTQLCLQDLVLNRKLQASSQRPYSETSSFTSQQIAEEVSDNVTSEMPGYEIVEEVKEQSNGDFEKQVNTVAQNNLKVAERAVQLRVSLQNLDQSTLNSGLSAAYPKIPLGKTVSRLNILNEKEEGSLPSVRRTFDLLREDEEQSMKNRKAHVYMQTRRPQMSKEKNINASNLSEINPISVGFGLQVLKCEKYFGDSPFSDLNTYNRQFSREDNTKDSSKPRSENPFSQNSVGFTTQFNSMQGTFISSGKIEKQSTFTLLRDIPPIPESGKNNETRELQEDSTDQDNTTLLDDDQGNQELPCIKNLTQMFSGRHKKVSVLREQQTYLGKDATTLVLNHQQSSSAIVIERKKSIKGLDFSGSKRSSTSLKENSNSMLQEE